MPRLNELQSKGHPWVLRNDRQVTAIRNKKAAAEKKPQAPQKTKSGFACPGCLRSECFAGECAGGDF